ncbi:Transcriptional regulatory protein YehT [compost metagenome]
MALQIAVVDDERASLEGILGLLSAHELIDRIDLFSNSKEALLNIPKLCPDVIILDIQMPGITGLHLAHQLRELLPFSAIIFVTAFQEYALKAYELGAIDYLLKPVRPERLQQALTKICKGNI